MPKLISPSLVVSSLLLGALWGCDQSTQDRTAADQAAPAPSADQAVASSGNASLWPQITSAIAKDPALEAKVSELLGKMSLEQKVGQIIQPELRQITPEDITRYSVGSILNGGGSFPGENKYAKREAWLALADSFYQASMSSEGGRVPVPVIWGTDAVHGHNNVIGATLYPHNIALGATRNPDLIRQIGRATAAEVMATGIDWTFAPTLAVTRDDRWGRTYESYSEDPALVQSYGGSMVEGLQGRAGSAELFDGTRVVATAKHFLADGGTQGGIDRGDAIMGEAELVSIHNAGYVSALGAGAQTVMASFSSWQGVKMHGNQYLLTQVLKERMGFDGFVVGDWNGHAFVPGCSTVSCPQAINAGLDMFMAPDANWKELYANTLAQVKSGEISAARLDDAVARILRVKLRAGLFDAGLPSQRPLAQKADVLGSAEHRAIARQAVRESLVLLKNNGAVLPAKPTQKILVTGDGADNIGKQAGGWTITWQGTGNSNSDFPGASSIYQGMADAVKAAGGQIELSSDGSYQQKPDVAFVVFGENPYAEMQGDVNSLIYNNAQDLALLQKLQADGIKVVALFITGRPLWVNPYINSADAFAVIWQPGSEGVGVADVVLAKADGSVNHDFAGKLPFSWPADPAQTPLNLGQADYQPQFAYGYGLSYAQAQAVKTLSEVVQKNTAAAGSSLAIFKQRPLAPWQLLLSDAVNNSVAVTTSKAELATVSISAVDYQVQEDARRARWNGSGKGSVSFASSQRSDLSPYAQQNMALVFDYQVHQAPAAAVTLAMECGTDCRAQVDISQVLTGAPQGQWQQLAIPLDCYAAGGVKMDMVVAPFVLSTAGALDITLYNLRIEAAEKAIACPAAK